MCHFSWTVIITTSFNRPELVVHVYPQYMEEQYHIFHLGCSLLLDELDY